MKTCSDIRSVLEGLGYSLSDNGNHWRTKALYRGGENPTSLLIYKDTGVWIDYAENPEKAMPLNRLVELSGGDPENISTNERQRQKVKLMEKIYPESMLQRLLPLTDFYEKRGISKSTQELYKCGYAGAGKLYKRIVFPIFDEHKRIIGFSGRHILDQQPKWKHLGKKRDWVYPLYLDGRFVSDIESTKEIILVESIGDSLALSERGIYSHFVMFGLNQMSALLKTLVRYAPDKITLALNNDKFKKESRDEGDIATAKLYFKLLKYFDQDMITINRPVLNDFGDMQKADNKEELFQQWMAGETDMSDHIQRWKELANQNVFNMEITKKINDTFIS